jgi:hypothetical protein
MVSYCAKSPEGEGARRTDPGVLMVLFGAVVVEKTMLMSECDTKFVVVSATLCQLIKP